VGDRAHQRDADVGLGAGGTGRRRDGERGQRGKHALLHVSSGRRRAGWFYFGAALIRYRPSASRSRGTLSRKVSSARTTSRPSRLATAVISCSKYFGPSRSASSTEPKRLPSNRGGSGTRVSMRSPLPNGQVRS